MYVMQSTFPIEKLDAVAFERAWQQVLDRHTVLRTSFHFEGLSRPVQVVRSRVRLRLEHLDWRDMAPGDQEARLQAFLRENRRRGFNLSEPPLIRVTTIR